MAITRITLSEGEPVRYRNEFIACRMGSDICSLLRLRRNASASSMNRIIPLLFFSAQSNNLFSSKTAYDPSGAMSDPTITAYSNPLCIASFFANSVLPVPGGP